jgi:GNAT superfamily N-acetyltransferase
MNSAIRLAPVIDELPADIDLLRTEAACEGYRFLERLLAEWMSHEVRFAHEGEALLAAYVGGELAGIGGMTVEPARMGALRMRRFYVRRSLRRHGIGRKLALALLEKARPLNCPVTVNAGTDEASAFWEAIGFLSAPQAGYTHILHPWRS